MGAPGISNSLLIAIRECQSAAEAEGLDLEGKLRAAMQLVTPTHWLAYTDDDRFRAAVGGVLLATEGEDKERVEVALTFLKTLAAAASGVPVDFASLVPEDEEDRVEPAPLKRIWDEVNA